MSYHGTLNGYTNIRCRCTLCRKAGSAENRQQKARRLAGRMVVDGILIHPDAPHGTENGYGNWGCRCDLCRRARAMNARELRRRRSAA